MVMVLESICEKLRPEAIRDNLRFARHVGIGALVMLHEEVSGLVDRLAERGEAAEKDGMGAWDRFRSPAPDEAPEPAPAEEPSEAENTEDA